MPLSLPEFVQRWKLNVNTENASSQEQFLNICELLGEPAPAESDPNGDSFSFERYVARTSGGNGWADVWKRGFFAWEYKGKNKDLHKAYQQLLDYREALLNPPLLVVSDMARFEVHTNWPNTLKRVYKFDLDQLKKNVVTETCPLPPLEVLRALFTNPDELRPNRTAARVTQDVAIKFSELARRLEIERQLTATPEQIAHFLIRILFCLFADSIGLLPDRVFRNMVTGPDRFQPARFLKKLGGLFRAMNDPEGGIFGEHTIAWFNGSLFNDDSVIELDKADMAILNEAASNYDWRYIAPEIFGTLFERSLDSGKRAQIGAHYTSAEDIETLVGPVVFAPLQERWQQVRLRVEEALEQERHEREAELAANNGRALLRGDRRSEKLLSEWFAELRAVRVLDPACGSGNFLYIVLRGLLDLWYLARQFGVENNISLVQPEIVSPTQLFGIETNLYAHELASVVVWIGFLQWKDAHGVHDERRPILQKLSNIQHDDAILRYDKKGGYFYEPAWPLADFIVSNPPFLGGKLLRRELGDTYVDDLFKQYAGKVRAESDLVCYWFYKAITNIADGTAKRAGLVSTQAIRGGANRDVLRQVTEQGSIFFAITDQKWLLPGAAVHVSMVAFEKEPSTVNVLDQAPVGRIHADLTSGADLTAAIQLKENRNLCFMGTTKIGSFDLSTEEASRMLRMPLNPNGRPNSDVVRPWINARDIAGRPRNRFIIDFGTSMTEPEASLYQAPFEHVREHVLPERKGNNREQYRTKWWIYGEPRPELRKRISKLRRFVVTPLVSKHRVFEWVKAGTIPENLLNAYVREDDYFFGILHSSVHEVWARAQGTQLREVESGFRYTPRTCFDTFPFPWPPGTEPSEKESPLVHEIAEAARDLVRKRDAWLNPPDAPEEELRRRTLTNLYNERPTWLNYAHTRLDRAVFTAYGWRKDNAREQILEQLLFENHRRRKL